MSCPSVGILTATAPQVACICGRVTAAEAEIIAQTARLGAAKSDLYPKFQLTGLLGRTATSPGGLTLGLGNFFFGGLGIQLPIFNGGRIRSHTCEPELFVVVRWKNFCGDVDPDVVDSTYW